MKLLFVVPHYGLADKLQIYDFPLGLAYVAATARQAGHDVFGLNMNHPGPSPEEAFRDIDVVLTGGLCTHYGETKKLVDMLREGWPTIKVVVGGGLYSGCPDLMHEMLKPDIGVVGEGEACIREVLNDIENGRHTRRYVPAPISDLKTLPRPDYELFDVKRYLANQYPNSHYYTCPLDRPRALAVIASRGCPFDCSFCFHPLGKGYRQRDPEDFLGEVEELVTRYDLNILCILDEVLGWKRERLEEILQGLKRFKILWMCQMRVDQVDKDLLKQMKDAGCYYISYGIESADNRVLKAMRKHITIEQIEQALQWTWDLKMGIQGNVLLGDAADTPESMTRTLGWWFRNRRYSLNAIRLVPYPDSLAWQRLTASGKLDPRTFIEEGCPAGFLRMHQMCGISPEFEREIWNHLIDLYQFAMPIIPCTLQQQEDFPDENLGSYIAESTCPWCGSAVRYERLILGASPFTRMICRNCYQGYLINVQSEFQKYGAHLRSGNKAYDETRRQQNVRRRYPYQ